MTRKHRDVSRVTRTHGRPQLAQESEKASLKRECGVVCGRRGWQGKNVNVEGMEDGKPGCKGFYSVIPLSGEEFWAERGNAR